MLSVLPPEIILSIFQFVSFPDIQTLHDVCKGLRNFIDINEQHIYRNLALYHEFDGSRETQVEDAVRSVDSPNWLKGCSTWKEYGESGGPCAEV